MNREKAVEELKEVNNNLSLFMKKKRALQKYIQEEDERLKHISSPIFRAKQLKNDEKFIEEHGRQRTSREIARLMNYSERQIRRFLQEKN